MQQIIPGVACLTEETLVFLPPLVPPLTFPIPQYIPFLFNWLDRISNTRFSVCTFKSKLQMLSSSGVLERIFLLKHHQTSFHCKGAAASTENNFQTNWDTVEFFDYLLYKNIQTTW